jgi:hypothetical protein
VVFVPLLEGERTVRNRLIEIARRDGAAPLAWAGGTTQQDYLNLGDALSAVMVSLLSGLPVRRVPFVSEAPRLVAVGTVGQNIAGGEAWFWGTGCSNRVRGGGGLIRFSPDPGLRAHVQATRGPISATLLGGGRLTTETWGDPVWLLPRFYRPRIEKRWDLGVIVHLSDLADRDFECHPDPRHRRYEIPAEFAGSVRLINTVTPRTVEGMKARLDEILSCRRIVSTSLHGMVFAESYGVPCLCFPPAGGGSGLTETPVRWDAPLDLRMLDLYAGIGRDRLPVYVQPRAAPTDWRAVMDAVDAAWIPAEIDEDALTAAFPLDLAPLQAPQGGDIWDHPTLRAFPYHHDVAEVRRADAAAARKARAAAAPAQAALRGRLDAGAIPATLDRPAPSRLRLGRDERGATGLRLAWARPPKGSAFVNLGDALSPVIVSALSGLPVLPAAFNEGGQRLAAVGTIGHALRGGEAHLWGCGLDVAVNPARPGAPWSAPKDGTLAVHALRGPHSAEAMRRAGVPAPEVFGDPVYLLDRLFPLEGVKKTHDLGVILHLTEVAPECLTPGSGRPTVARPEHRRYEIPAEFAGSVRLIDMFVEPTLPAFEAKLREIASCRAILSTSLHGLVLADVYGVPNAWFGFGERGLHQVDPANPDSRIDHRMRDLYAGMGVAAADVVATRRDTPSDWEAVIAMTAALSVRRPDMTALLAAFPGPLAVDPAATRWPLPDASGAGLEREAATQDAMPDERDDP